MSPHSSYTDIMKLSGTMDVVWVNENLIVSQTSASSRVLLLATMWVMPAMARAQARAVGFGRWPTRSFDQPTKPTTTYQHTANERLTGHPHDGLV
jgi:hypothetical protein